MTVNFNLLFSDRKTDGESFSRSRYSYCLFAVNIINTIMLLSFCIVVQGFSKRPRGLDVVETLRKEKASCIHRLHKHRDLLTE